MRTRMSSAIAADDWDTGSFSQATQRISRISDWARASASGSASGASARNARSAAARNSFMPCRYQISPPGETGPFVSCRLWRLRLQRRLEDGEQSRLGLLDDTVRIGDAEEHGLEVLDAGIREQ